MPEDGIPATGMNDGAVVLSGHGRKSTEVIWNPAAEGVLASAGADAALKIWDANNGTLLYNLEQHPDAIQSFQWNQQGNLIGTQCRDKKIRVFDVRANTKTLEVQSHQGVKTSRLVINNQKGQIISTGFGTGSNRQILIWDMRQPEKPIVQNVVDQASGVMSPFFDEATQILFIAGKGEANIRYYEITDEAPLLHYITTFADGTPTRGITAMPKIFVNAGACEIMKFYKITAKETIEPVSFVVPRRSEMFQPDLFPPVVDTSTPSMTTQEWATEGKNTLQRQFVFTADGHQAFAPPPTTSPAPCSAAQPCATSSSSTPSQPHGAKKEELDAARARIAELEAQVKELQSSAAATGSSGGDGAGRIAELEAKLAEMDAEITAVKQDNAAKEAEIAEKQTQIDELKAQIKAIEEQ
jgi:polyhydroxyalkanoate synthesis regulator phasin